MTEIISPVNTSCTFKEISCPPAPVPPSSKLGYIFFDPSAADFVELISPTPKHYSHPNFEEGGTGGEQPRNLQHKPFDLLGFVLPIITGKITSVNSLILFCHGLPRYVYTCRALELKLRSLCVQEVLHCSIQLISHGAFRRRTSQGSVLAPAFWCIGFLPLGLLPLGFLPLGLLPLGLLPLGLLPSGLLPLGLLPPELLPPSGRGSSGRGSLGRGSLGCGSSVAGLWVVGLRSWVAGSWVSGSWASGSWVFGSWGICT